MSLYNFAGASTGAALLPSVSAANTAAATSAAGFDLRDYDAGVIVIQNHGLGTGTLDGKIQDSADNSSFADVTGLTFTQSTTTADQQILAFNPKSVRRYIRYVGTIATGPHVIGVSLVGVKKAI